MKKLYRVEETRIRYIYVLADSATEAEKITAGHDLMQDVDYYQGSFDAYEDNSGIISKYELLWDNEKQDWIDPYEAGYA